MSGAHASSFGAQLRRYREAAGLSQEDLAERASLAAKAIGALERGERRRPYPRTVQMLADALQLNDTQRRELIAAVPRARVAQPGESEVFVGRERELAELMAKLRAASAGRGGIVMVLGEAGIGKTRLVHELMAKARDQDAVVLSGRAFEGDGQMPFGPWIEAIERHALGRDPEALRADLGFDGPYLAQLVPLLRDRLPDLPRPEPLGTSDERLRLFGAVARLCVTLGENRPVLIVLDDLHWADRDTLALMRYVAATLSDSRVLLVGAYRDPELGVDADHPLIATLSSLRHEMACPSIRLDGLDRVEIASYLNHSAGHTLAPALIERIGRESSGNPFYAREVLRHVGEGAADPSRRYIEHAAEVSTVSEGVRQVVADRVRRLSAETARTLRDACGLTGGFAFPLLAELAQLPEGQLLDCLDEAVEAGFLRAPVRDGREYEFAHAIVRHALYEGQSRDRRVRLHRRIASALEGAYRGDELAHAAELAVHYHASAELAGATAGLRYALAAADQARAAFAHDGVVTFLRMAWDLAGEADAGAKIEILTRLAVAEAETVQLLEARGSADRALQVMASSGTTPRARAEFIASVAQALKLSGAGGHIWEPLIDHGLGLLKDDRGAAWARLTLLRDHYESVRSGPVASGRWLGQDRDAVAIARASQDETDYARTLEPLEWRTRAETDAIYARVKTWSRPLALLKGLELVLRDLEYKHGDFVAALEVAGELLAAARRFGSVSSEAEARAQTAVCLLSLGDIANARARIAEAMPVIARLGQRHRLHLVPIGVSVGLAYFLDAEWRTIAESGEAFTRTNDDQRHPAGGLVAAAYTTLAFARANKLDEARAWLRDIAIASEGGAATTYLQHWALVVAADTAWEIDFAEPASTYRRLLRNAASVGAGPTTFGSVELALARTAALLGDFAEAEEFFARAAGESDRSDHRAMQAIIAYDQARALQRSGARDTRVGPLLLRARSTFAELEMRWWLRRAQALRG